MKKIAKVTSIALASMMLLSMGACGGSSGGDDSGSSASGLKLKINANATKEITFEYLKAGFGDDPYIAVANAFMERNPDVQVRTYANREIVGTTQNNLTSGQGVSDIYSYPYNAIKTWIKDGLLEDLTSLCAEQTLDGRTMLESMTGSASQAISADGKIYGVPEYTSVTGFVYNQELFEQYNWEIPETTKDLEDLCKKIIADTNGAVAPITWCKDAEGYLYFATENWISQYAGVENMEKFYALESPEVYALEDNEEGSLYTPKKAALENLLKFFLPLEEGGYAANNSRTTSNGAAQLAILEGDCAMMLNGSWFYNEMKRVWEDERIGIFAIPEMSDANGNVLRAANNPETNGRVLTADYGAYYFIPTNAPQKEVAKDFLLYLSSEEACTIYTQYANTIRPFIYNVGEETDLYKNITNFGKSVLKIADEYTLYAPVSNSIVALKGHGGLWPRGTRVESEITQKNGDQNAENWLNKDYLFASQSWDSWN